MLKECPLLSRFRPLGNEGESSDTPAKSRVEVRPKTSVVYSLTVRKMTVYSSGSDAAVYARAILSANRA